MAGYFIVVFGKVVDDNMIQGLHVSVTGSITYKAQSQDEEALVSAAAQLKVVLVSRTASSLCMYKSF